MTAGTLNTLHNLHFYLDTMRRIREAIVFATLEELRQSYRRIFPAQPVDPPNNRLYSVSQFVLAMGSAAGHRASIRTCSSFPSRSSSRSSISSSCCRPSRNRRSCDAFLAALKVGDRVVTTGGIYGSVTKVNGTVGAAAGGRTTCASRWRRAPSAAIRDRNHWPKATTSCLPYAGRSSPSSLVFVVFFGIGVYPILASRYSLPAPQWLLAHQLKLGLDLKGGVHLVLRVQTDDALRVETEQEMSAGCRKS